MSSDVAGGIYSKQLKLKIGPILAVCLHDVALIQPADPIYFIAQWLYRYADSDSYFTNKSKYFRHARESIDSNESEGIRFKITKQRMNSEILKLMAVKERLMQERGSTLTTPNDSGSFLSINFLETSSMGTQDTRYGVKKIKKIPPKKPKFPKKEITNPNKRMRITSKSQRAPERPHSLPTFNTGSFIGKQNVMISKGEESSEDESSSIYTGRSSNSNISDSATGGINPLNDASFFKKRKFLKRRKNIPDSDSSVSSQESLHGDDKYPLSLTELRRPTSSDIVEVESQHLNQADKESVSRRRLSRRSSKDLTDDDQHYPRRKSSSKILGRHRRKSLRPTSSEVINIDTRKTDSSDKNEIQDEYSTFRTSDSTESKSSIDLNLISSNSSSLDKPYIFEKDHIKSSDNVVEKDNKTRKHKKPKTSASRSQSKNENISSEALSKGSTKEGDPLKQSNIDDAIEVKQNESATKSNAHPTAISDKRLLAQSADQIAVEQYKQTVEERRPSLDKQPSIAIIKQEASMWSGVKTEDDEDRRKRWRRLFAVSGFIRRSVGLTQINKVPKKIQSRRNSLRISSATIDEIANDGNTKIAPAEKEENKRDDISEKESIPRIRPEQDYMDFGEEKRQGFEKESTEHTEMNSNPPITDLDPTEAPNVGDKENIHELTDDDVSNRDLLLTDVTIEDSDTNKLTEVEELGISHEIHGETIDDNTSIDDTDLKTDKHERHSTTDVLKTNSQNVTAISPPAFLPADIDNEKDVSLVKELDGSKESKKDLKQKRLSKKQTTGQLKAKEIQNKHKFTIPRELAHLFVTEIGTWHYIRAENIMMFRHPVLGELRAPPRLTTNYNDNWKPTTSCESIYDHELYLVCDSTYDDEEYRDRLLEWTGTNWSVDEKL